MAITSAAPVVASRSAAAGTVAVVAPHGSPAHAEAFARRGWRTVTVEPEAGRRPSMFEPARETGIHADSVKHRGSLRQTVKALRGLGVSAVVAGSAAGVGLADRIAWHLGFPLGDPETSPLRGDRGAQAAALARAGIPAPRGVRSTELAEVLAWAEACPLPGYLLAPAAAGTPVDPVACAGGRQINTTWPVMKEAAARYSDDAHLVLTEQLPVRQFVVNSVSRPGPFGQTEHVVTDVWAETRSCDGSLDRSDLLPRHEPMVRALSAYMARVLDTLGVLRGPVTARVAHDERRGPLLVSALAVPGISPADEALRSATGYDRLTDALDTSVPPLPVPLGAGTAGHRIVRVHLRRSGDAVDPRLGHILRRLPTVVAAGPEPSAHAPALDKTRCAEVVLSSDRPEAVEADYGIIRALEGESVYAA
ncbi:hypothetical protein ACGFT2_02070 [Streptomyces sp. NPDC048514]|uniref:hypothetical protein n=1 Tax=Streptomyces sp. NPDC048514 TaxID=3365564 RepID=UPI00371407D3